MPSEKYQPLIRIMPFEGIDATTADVDESPELAKSAPNVDPYRSTGAMATARGRIALGSVTGSSGATAVDAIVETGYAAEELYISNNGAGSTAVLKTTATGMGTQTAVANAVRFVQAIPFASYLSNTSVVTSLVITNTGQQILNANAFTLQRPAPAITSSNITLTPAAGAYNIVGGVNGVNNVVYYAFTYQVGILVGSTIYESQETSPNVSAFAPFTIEATLTAGTNYEITITLTSGSFSGTFSDGSTYATNVYRLSSDQPQWYFVGVASGTSFVDNFSQTTISANAVLDLHHDPPPFGVNAVIFSHRDRLWWFTDIVSYGPNNYGTYATQLWYSDYGIPWSYDAVNQALLVGADNPESVMSSGNILTNGYVASYGNYPMAGLSISGVAILWKKYKAYVVDGVDEATFFVSELTGVSGCIARKSVAAGVQEVYWLSERGVETWALGGGSTYIGEPIRTIINGYSANDRAASVGWYSAQSYFISFPTQNTTFIYRIEAKKWYGPLPYATSYVSSLPADPSPGSLGGLNSLLAVRASSALSIDAWGAAETDLTAAITATWNSPISDSGRPWQRKGYRFITVGAPVQVGVTAIVTLTTWDLNASTGTAYSFSFDLGVAPYQTQSVPVGCSRGFYASVQITLTNTSAPATYAQLWSVVVGGEFLEVFDQASS